MKKHIVAAFLAVLSTSLPAQVPPQVGQWLENYEFAKAADALKPVVEADSLNGEAALQLVESLNGEALLQYVARPVVVASKRVPKADFQLCYEHLKNGAWRDGGVYFEDGASDVFIVRDGKVCRSWRLDSLQWAAPEPVVMESSDGTESWPLISYNGRDLYFSSDNLYGIGGSDIYVTSFDSRTGRWSTPRNLGMPFNSPANDFLYSETSDGRYAVFASDRDCGRDEVVIYVVKYENWARSAASPSEALELSHLKGGSKEPGSYSFVKLSSGGKLDLPFEEEEPEFDYTFTVGKTGSFAENNSLPEGIVYQIQIFVTGGKAGVSQLKGLSPVWCHRQPSGRNLYAAGLFRNYEDAAAALPKVRQAGFQTAFIIAFNNGRTMNVNKARAAAKEVKVLREEVHVIQ